MKRWVSTVGMVLFLGFVLISSVVPAEALNGTDLGIGGQVPISGAQDPAQLSTAAVLLVKFDPTVGTDTIVVFNRQQVPGDSTPGGTSSKPAITIHVRFFDADCHSRFDNNVTLTNQQMGPAPGAILVSKLFPSLAANKVPEPGIVLAETFTTSAFPLFAISGVVVDLNFIALYERQGSPLLLDIEDSLLNILTPGFSGPPTVSFVVWGGFSPDDIDDWYIGGFTMLQMICPQGALAAAMNSDAKMFDALSTTTFADAFQVNVYDTKETLLGSADTVFCKCYNDSSLTWSKITSSDGDTHTQIAHGFPDVISLMAGNVGTFHWVPNGNFIAWRTISNGAGIFWDARLRITAGTPVTPETPIPLGSAGSNVK